MFTKRTVCFLIIILHARLCLNLCIERERRALLQIEKDIYDPDDWLSSWRRGGDCCNWQGITCHNTTGHVINLDLPYPYFWPNTDAKYKMPAKSKLNPSLVDLKHLTRLDLNLNNFGGASIPIFIGSLNRLEYLDLSSSGFKGTIPSQLGNLSSLKVLRIDNRFETVPFGLRVDDLHWLSRLTSLTSLRMNQVNLSTAVDWFDDITKLPFITAISFRNSSLSSIPLTMPPLNNFTFLQTLDLSYNSLNSNISGWLFNNISSLESLWLDGCGLYGELPLLSGQVSNLNFLHFENNNIDASISKTLWNLRNLTHLTDLGLSYNHIHGCLPKTLGNYSQMELLAISWNYITGEIPHNIGNLFRLKDLRMDSNNLGGDIPHSLFNMTNLQSLVLSNNNFSGEVPKSINLNQLDYLDLSNNRLNGSIFFNDQSIIHLLDISNNYFTGTVPFSSSTASQLRVVNLSNNSFTTIPNLFMFHPYLESLQLGKNKLNGLIPSSLKNCIWLSFLDLSENKLYGAIPPWIGGSLLSLQVLNLRSNNFNGQIPKELSCLTSLQILDLSHNQLEGNFSLTFGNFTAMTKPEKKVEADDNFKFNSDGYLEHIWLDKQGIMRLYSTTLLYTILIDVSSNEISGEIPIGITKLVGLKFLNLARNHFIGNIPKNMGAIKALEVLDLSSNKLSGEIPSTMAELNFLSSMNVSYNNLSGMIPTENQFQSFDDPSIYIGNSNLCGWPLPKCSRSNSNNTNFDGKENEEHEYWYEKTWINVGTVVGFLISSWGIFITLLLSKSMRRLHFYCIDKLYSLISLQFHIGIARIKSKIMEPEMH